MMYAAKHYDNPYCESVEEFEDDLKKFLYIRKLFNRYESVGDLKERLILNHIMVVYNCFGLGATEMLFMKLEGFHHYLKPFLDHLNFLPPTIEYDGKRIIAAEIAADKRIEKRLGEI